MEREELVLRRIEYLERLAEKLERLAAVLFAAAVASPVLEKLTGLRLAAAVAMVAVALAVLVASVYTLRMESERLWGKLLGRDPRLLAFPWGVLALLIATIGLLLALTH